jgi:hypothetical protein
MKIKFLIILFASLPLSNALISAVVVAEINATESILNENYHLDLDLDGVPEFQFDGGQIFCLTPSGGVAAYREYPGALNTGALAQVFAGGSAIDESSLASGFEWVNLTTSEYRGVLPEFYLGPNRPPAGPGPGIADWYVGLRLIKADGPHYGWIFISTARIDSDIQIFSSGFETIPNRTIITPVPEPTIGAALLGGVTLALRRRRVARRRDNSPPALVI